MSGRSLESLFQMPCSLVDGTATGNSAEATSTTLGDLRASKAAVYGEKRGGECNTMRAWLLHVYMCFTQGGMGQRSRLEGRNSDGPSQNWYHHTRSAP